MMNLSDLKNEITNVPRDEPVFIYVGVGVASSSNQEHLTPDQYQQFPPFLQNMQNLVPKLHLFLVLIDPLQENPPRVAIDYQLVEPRNDYYNKGKLHVFVYRHRVYTDVDLNPIENGINITETLRDLNKFVKENQVSLLYHDFTGRQTTHLAEYFDIDNMQHLDQLIYSLSAREDHGCFFDLTQPNAYFPFRVANEVALERPVIKMFNYYKYIVNNSYGDIANELAEYPEEMKMMANVQREQIINNIRNQFKNNNLSILRKVKKLITASEAVASEAAESEAAESEAAESEAAESEAVASEAVASEAAESEAAESAAAAEIAHAKYLFSELPHLYKQMFTELYTEKDYTLIHELLFNYSSSELDILSRLKGLDLSGEELLTFITADVDPYKWHNNLNMLI